MSLISNFTEDKIMCFVNLTRSNIAIEYILSHPYLKAQFQNIKFLNKILNNFKHNKGILYYKLVKNTFKSFKILCTFLIFFLFYIKF